MIWGNLMDMIAWIPTTVRACVIALFASGIIISAFKLIKWIKELILF